jgi:hypothetical protein
MNGPYDPGRSRADLMVRHVQARRRRDAAPLGSAEYRAACEEIASVEVAIAALEEPRAPSPAAPEAATGNG